MLRKMKDLPNNIIGIAIDFVTAHHRDIRRVAIAVDGALPSLAALIAPRLLMPEFKRFSFR